jgi:deoxyribodipyrimidine photo-lyase
MSAAAAAASAAGTTAMIVNSPVVHAPKSMLPPWMAASRTRKLYVPTATQPHESAISTTASSASSGGCVAYWMQRDVRVRDNYALSWAAHLAAQHNVALRVYYALPPPPPPLPTTSADQEDASLLLLPPDLDHLPITERYGTFLLGGLECVHKELQQLQVPLHVLQPSSHDTVGNAVYRQLRQDRARIVVCDFGVLRHHRLHTEVQLVRLLEKEAAAAAAGKDSSAAAVSGVPHVWQVDAHNVVPAWTVPARQVGARTLRPKLHKVMADYLVDNFPDLSEVLSSSTPAQDVQRPSFDRDAYLKYMQLDKSVPAVEWAVPGTDAALTQLNSFASVGLSKYDALRNDPTHATICSNLSPWINHGHVSFQRVALLIKKMNKHASGSASFLEEGIVRRELSDNYLYYTPNDYDQLTGAAEWAQQTLQVHASDPRESTYSLDEWEHAQTHDDLWNAAQLQVVREGQMHGFLRMYWAKKILEWSQSPEVALRTAQYLNDKYALDGRDPNGFVGVGWSIMGIHDQGWGERPVFGKIRYVADIVTLGFSCCDC